MIQQTIKNRYEVTQFLGKGGFGETYLAKDLDFPGHPLRVVKILRPENSDPQSLEIARRLFKTEAETLSRLGKHDLIPELFAYFEYKNEFYLVQEYIDGYDLSKEIYEGNQLNEKEVIELIRDILIGLKIVHDNKVIHRDLKPPNLIRRHLDKKIVIIDFGGVKQIVNSGHNSPQKTIMIGTDGYFPPEQSQGLPVLGSDIYAVGAIAIQALTGEMSIPKDWQKKVKISPKFLNILTRMIQDAPKIRYSSANDTLKAIYSLIPSSHNSSSSSTIQTIITTVTSKPAITLFQKITLGVMAIAILIVMLSFSIDLGIFQNNPSSEDKTLPAGEVW